MNETIDWKKLAGDLGLLSENGEIGGTEYANRAIELLIGEDRLRAAVDFYVTGRGGSGLARSVLWRIQAWSAMQRCYEIYRSDAPVEIRRSAIELLRVVADHRALGWVKEFLADPDDSVQNMGAGVLDQMIWGGGVQPELCREHLKIAREHPNPNVRETAAFIDEYLKKWES